MSSLRSVPSQTEPTGIAELIADAQHIVLPRQAGIERARTEQATTIVIPADSVTLVEGYDDYGV